MTRKPVVLCILDGWGINADPSVSAPAQAHVPNFNRLWATCPHSTLTTFGPDVGLPRGQNLIRDDLDRRVKDLLAELHPTIT